MRFDWNDEGSTFGAAGVERIGDVAWQADMQRAAEALVMRLGGRIRHDAVRVVKLPTKGDDTALHSIIRLLTHKAVMNTWNKMKSMRIGRLVVFQGKPLTVSRRVLGPLWVTKRDPPVLHSWQRNFPLGAADRPMHCRWKAPKHGPSHTKRSPVFSHTCKNTHAARGTLIIYLSLTQKVKIITSQSVWRSFHLADALLKRCRSYFSLNITRGRETVIQTHWHNLKEMNII